jgi:hypothetical protein
MNQWFDFVPMVLSEALTLALLFLLVKRKMITIVPFFGIYLAYSCCAALARMLTSLDYSTFFYVFWVTELFYLILSVLCVYKSLSSAFRGLMLIRWFSILYPMLCAGIVGYSLWKAIERPPIEGYPITNLTIGIEFGAQYLVAGTFLLFMGAMAWLRRSRAKLHLEIVAGFGVASMGMLLSTLVRSEFGTRFLYFTKFAPTVAYILALVIWLSAFYTPLLDAHSETDGRGFTVESAERELEQYQLTLRKTGRWEP